MKLYDAAPVAEVSILESCICDRGEGVAKRLAYGLLEVNFGPTVGVNCGPAMTARNLNPSSAGDAANLFDYFAFGVMIEVIPAI